MDWTAGYIAEIDYTHGYYGEIAPNLIDFALLLKGFAPPVRTSGMRYLELGYGQGLSTNIHGAVYSGEFWGTDMNPAHASNAQTIAAANANGVKFFDQSIEEFAARDDLPEFDYITMHGLWTWIAEETRNAVCDILRKKLKVGGVFYVSYNALPGWTQVMPLRHLLSLYADTVAGDAQGIIGRVDAALNFGKEIAAANGQFFNANPVAAARLDSMTKQNRQYVTHEYFNRHWSPSYFAEVDSKLTEAKVSFAASATVLETVDGINLTGDQLKVLGEIGQSVMRETVRDYFVNQQFRRDLFTRGARRLSVTEQAERLGNLAFVLTNSVNALPKTITTALGQLQLKPEIYEPIATALGDDNMAPKTLKHLLSLDGLKGIDFNALVEAMTILTGCGFAHPVQTPSSDVEERAARLSMSIIESARLSGQITSLPSPVTGTGIPVSRFEQLFLLERAKGVADAQDWGKSAWSILKSQNQRLIIDGQILQSEDDNEAELIKQAATFAQNRLPILINLKVA
jgi:SAM-dependent methyltransferase